MIFTPGSMKTKCERPSAGAEPQWVSWVTGHPPNLKFLKSHPPFLQWSPIDTHTKMCAIILQRLSQLYKNQRIQPLALSNLWQARVSRNLAAKVKVGNSANVELKGVLCGTCVGAKQLSLNPEREHPLRTYPKNGQFFPSPPMSLSGRPPPPQKRASHNW